MNEILARFIDPTEPREWMRRPFRHGGFVYCTNGHFGIRVPDAEGIDADEATEEALGAVELLNRPHPLDRLWLPIPEVSGRACAACDGSGNQPRTVAEQCDECDGDGGFIHGSHNYVCKECDGEGEVHRKDGGTVQCDTCFGTALHIYEREVVGTQGFAKRYLALVRACFPGVEIGTCPNVRDDQAMGQPAGCLRAPGMVGLLMPMG